jgi:hypothetical protein
VHAVGGMLARSVELMVLKAEAARLLKCNY